MKRYLKIMLDDGQVVEGLGNITEWGVQIRLEDAVYLSYPWRRINECLSVEEEVAEVSEFGGDPIIRDRSMSEMKKIADARSRSKRHAA